MIVAISPPTKTNDPTHTAYIEIHDTRVPQKWTQSLSLALWWETAVQVLSPSPSITLAQKLILAFFLFVCFFTLMSVSIYLSVSLVFSYLINIVIDSWALLLIIDTTLRLHKLSKDSSSARWQHIYHRYFENTLKEVVQGEQIQFQIHSHAHTLPFY